MGNSIQEGVASGLQIVLPVSSWDSSYNGQIPIAPNLFTVKVNILSKVKLIWVLSNPLDHLSY